MAGCSGFAPTRSAIDFGRMEFEKRRGVSAQATSLVRTVLFHGMPECLVKIIGAALELENRARLKEWRLATVPGSIYPRCSRMNTE